MTSGALTWFGGSTGVSLPSDDVTWLSLTFSESSELVRGWKLKKVGAPKVKPKHLKGLATFLWQWEEAVAWWRPSLFRSTVVPSADGGSGCAMAPPAGLMMHHFLLPVVIQQLAEVVELMDAGGQPERSSRWGEGAEKRFQCSRIKIGSFLTSEKILGSKTQTFFWLWP